MNSDLAATKDDSAQAESRSLRALPEIRPLYILPTDPFANELLIPAFGAASRVECMVGFFSSAVLASLAPGLATFINSSQHSVRLIICPILRTEDLKAIEEGVKPVELVAQEILNELIITEDLLQQHTLKCLSWLLQMGRIEIKVALMKDALFHPKVWLFEGNSDVLAAHGSSNITNSGLLKNIEQMTVSKSWEDANQRYITDKFSFQFQRLWDKKEDNCLVIPIPEAVSQNILQTYRSDAPPTEEDLRNLYIRATERHANADSLESLHPPETKFCIPAWLQFDSGPFAHQGDAVSAWCQAGYRGILEMATGSGKTIASMISAHRLYEQKKPLLIVVAAPFIPLIQQWCDEIEPFGLKPVNLSEASGPQQRANELQKIKRRLRMGLSDVEVIVVTHDILCSADFQEALSSFQCNRLLIADEAHNLGRSQFISAPPEFFEYRLALSATPERQYDPDGTDALIRFFGPVIFQFALEQAIGHCLVEYDYYLHPVYLTESEMERWYELTNKIRENAWREQDGKPDDFLSKLLRDRRQLLEMAAGKIPALNALLEKEDLKNLKHTLIYASDKGPEQLDAVNDLLRQKRILFHQLTKDETRKRDLTRKIIKLFQEGEYQVLTAKRVLDEGVNIPQICKAFLLASTTVERQWIQRRGRLLRTCKSINKTHSVIHDLIALPPQIDQGLDRDARKLVRSELQRAQEFAQLARNAGRPDGPLPIISELVRLAYTAEGPKCR